MKISVALIVLLTFHSATSAVQQPRSRSPRPSSGNLKPKLHSEKDIFCPPKEERGGLCPKGQPRVSKRRGCTPLMQAAESGSINEVRALLKAGADVNAKLPNWGHTSLMLAAGGDQLEVVKVLLAAGADPNAVAFGHGGVPGWTWMFAMNRCNRSWLEILDALLAAGVDVNPKSIYASPLVFAIEKRDEVMIQALLQRGADPNLMDLDTGRTPLMFAANYSSPEVVKTLIAAGADVNARDKEGKTALTIVEEYGENLWQKEIVLLLKQAGAKR